MTITLSDPWELVTELGSGPFEVHPIAPMSQDGRHLLCLLETPLNYRSLVFRYVVIEARHAEVHLADASHTSIPCNISSLTDHEGESRSVNETIPSQERVGMIGSFDPRTIGVKE